MYARVIIILSQFYELITSHKIYTWTRLTIMVHYTVHTVWTFVNMCVGLSILLESCCFSLSFQSIPCGCMSKSNSLLTLEAFFWFQWKVNSLLGRVALFHCCLEIIVQLQILLSGFLSYITNQSSCGTHISIPSIATWKKKRKDYTLYDISCMDCNDLHIGKIAWKDCVENAHSAQTS